MALPGFTAEASVGPTVEQYRVPGYYGLGVQGDFVNQQSDGDMDLDEDMGDGETAEEGMDDASGMAGSAEDDDIEETGFADEGGMEDDATVGAEM